MIMMTRRPRRQSSSCGPKGILGLASLSCLILLGAAPLASAATNPRRREAQPQQQQQQAREYYTHHRLLHAGAVILTPNQHHNPLEIVSSAFQAAAPPKGSTAGGGALATDCLKPNKGIKGQMKMGKAGKGSKKGPPICGEGGGGGSASGVTPETVPPIDDGGGGSVAPPGTDDDDTTVTGDDVINPTEDDTVTGDDVTNPGLNDDAVTGRDEPTATPIWSAPTSLAPVMAPVIPTTPAPVMAPVVVGTAMPTTLAPIMNTPTSLAPVTRTPTAAGATAAPTLAPTTLAPTTLAPTTLAPSAMPTPKPDPCQAVADATLISNASNQTTFDIQLGLAISSTASVEQVLDELRRALQTTMAPGLTNCSAATATSSVRRRYLQTDTTTSTSTTIANVVFGNLEVDQFNDCSDFGITADDGQTICVTTNSLVTAYYDGGTLDGFPDSLETAVMSSSDLGIEGNDIVSTLVTESAQGTPPVPEGEGGGGTPSNDDDTAATDDDELTNDDDGTSGIEDPSNVDPGSGGISAGSAVGVTAGVLAVIFISMFAIRRNRRKYREENSLLKPTNTDDDDDDELVVTRSMSTYSTPPQKRIAHVVGEDDSIVTSDYTMSDGIEVQPIYATSRINRNLMDNNYSYDEDYMTDEDPANMAEMDSHDHDVHLEHHWCSSPHCQSCELKRQKGVTFIPTGPHRSSTIPVDARRKYNMNDTVDL